MMDLTAADTARLRRELVDYHRGPHSGRIYTAMIGLGRQPVRPPGDHDEVGQLLAWTEADRLAKADLWHVDGDLADLVDAAFPSMPPFAARPFDLPSRHGFVTFARPLSATVRMPDDVEAAIDRWDTTGSPELVEEFAQPIATHAVAWGPAEESAVAHQVRHWPAGGVWMSFYAPPAGVRSPEFLDRMTPSERSQFVEMTSAMAVENETVIAWAPDGAVDLDAFMLQPNGIGTAAWGAAVLTAFLLARQGNVTEQHDQAVARPERRRYTRAGMPEPGPVRVLRLRRSVRGDQAPAGGSSREYRHRWMVRGHWRNQWYPSIKDHRPKWIAQYLAGPDGAPLIGGDKVTRLTAPPGQ